MANQINSVEKLRWANGAKTALSATVTFDDGREWPMCVHANYDTDEGLELWTRSKVGEFGAIAAYVEPPVTPEPAPDEISRRQFFQYLAVIGIISKAEALAAMQGGVIPAPLQAIIDQLPTEDDKFNAQMFAVGAQNFNRLHWLTDVVRQAMSWTLEQRDEFWREAAKL